jgi:hypothetical protein
MRTQIIISCIAWGLLATACEDEKDTATTTLEARGGGGASLDGGRLAGDAAVLDGLSCGGLVGDSTCDPVTAWPCDTSRENCVYSASRGAYECAEIANQQAHCSPCDEQTLFCGPGLLCNRTLGCERFCCVDSDCPVGRCTLDAYLDDDVARVGWCEEETLAVCVGEDAGTAN